MIMIKNYLTRFLIFVAISLCSHAAFSQTKTIFHPAKNIETSIEKINQTVTVTVLVDAIVKSQNIITEETEKEIHIKIDDFNFDGFKDFSLSHVDDGMGTYTIDRVFLYSPKDAKFIEANSKCGDGFLNLQLLKRKKMLRSTYYANNRPKLCIQKLDVAK
jgi:hypothetical protein